MGLQKIKTPVEYSFYQWMNSFPDSTHPCDKKRFYTFVRTVCRYNAKKWKDINFVRQKILDKKPSFDKKYLDRLMNLMEELIQYSKIQPINMLQSVRNLKVKDGYFLEITIKNGNIEKKELPVNQW